MRLAIKPWTALHLLTLIFVFRPLIGISNYDYSSGSLGGRTVAAPPFAGIHVIPARSKAAFIFSIVANVMLPPFSNRVTVLAVIPA